MLSAAERVGLEVIPLVQTFGHLEFALKLEEFREEREVPYYPQAICPSRDRSWRLVTQIVDQVLSLHPKARWVGRRANQHLVFIVARYFYYSLFLLGRGMAH